MLRALSRNPRPTFLLDGRGGCPFPPEHLLCGCGCGCATAKDTRYLPTWAQGSHLPSSLEPQTQADTRGVGSLACIAPDLDLDLKLNLRPRKRKVFPTQARLD